MTECRICGITDTETSHLHERRVSANAQSHTAILCDRCADALKELSVGVTRTAD